MRPRVSGLDLRIVLKMNEIRMSDGILNWISSISSFLPARLVLVSGQFGENTTRQATKCCPVSVMVTPCTLKSSLFCPLLVIAVACQDLSGK